MATLTTTGPTAPTHRSPQNLLAAISWALLVTVMFGGYSLLMLLTGSGELSAFEERFFRAGHAHAGVLAAIGILYSGALARTLLAPRHQIAAWVAYLIGVLLQSGGMFVHMLVGEEGERSAGTWVTISGAIVLASSVLFLAWQLFRARHVAFPSPSAARSEGDSHA